MNTHIRQSLKILSFFLLLFIPFNTLSAETIHVGNLPSAGENFWMVHGFFEGTILCLLLALFPRLTLAFMAIFTGAIDITLLGLLLWILTPHLLVAIIATTLYWDTNTILVIFAWFIAFGGEMTEKVYIRRRF